MQDRSRLKRVFGSLGLSAAIVSGALALAPTTASATQAAQALPYSQNWSGTAGLITVNDDWTQVPGIEGYLGQDITTSTAGVDPQTLTAPSAVANDLTVLANAAPSSTAGDVAELSGLPDPTIALQGSGTADAPYVLISVATTGQGNVNVAYNLRDVDATATDVAVMKVALQYRVGNSGNFTNVPAGYVAAATSAVGGEATLVTPVSATLPPAADNQALVQIRVITSNATGSDQWVGVDDIVISGTPVVGNSAPTVLSTSPAAAATGVALNADVTVTFSEPVTSTDAFALSCTTSGAHPVTTTGGPTTFTLNPSTDFVSAESCTLTVTAAGIVDQGTPPATLAADYTTSFSTVAVDPCLAPTTSISAIQGNGAAVTLTTPVLTKGVVVGDYEGSSATGALRGFYIQDPAGDADPATSDAIFVFNVDNNSVAVGDLVAVAGTPAEFRGQSQLGFATITKCGTGTVTPTDIALPMASATTFEAYEGMLVRFPQTLFVSEHFQLGRFGQVLVSGTNRLRQPTAAVAPGAAANAMQATNDLNKLLIDDASQLQNPDPIIFGRNGLPLSASNTLRGGDTTVGASGVLTYTWAGNSASGDAFRLRPVNSLGGSVQFTAANSRPTSPVVGGTLTAVGMNLLNYFNSFNPTSSTPGCSFGVGGAAADCRGADNQTEFDRQSAKTVAAILAINPDVLGVNEIENDGYGPTSALADLVGKLNAATAPDTYAYVDVDAGTSQTNALGTDAIKVGLIYKPGKVTAVGTTAALNTAAFVNGGDGAPRNRASLAQAFEEIATGGRFVVNVNHLKSKGSACDIADAGDGQANCAVVRTNAANALSAWLATDPTGINDPDTLLLGDYNSYTKEDPITALVNNGYTNLIDTLGPDAYSYVFDGQWGYLDYAFGSSSIVSQIASVSEFHINADEPSLLDYNTNFKSAGQIASLFAADQYRVSDHDPVVVGLSLAKPATTTTLTATPSGLVAGQPYTVKAAVSPTAAGSVTFSDGTGSLGSVTLANSEATLAQTRGAGSYTYTGTYSGAATLGASSGTVTVVVAPAPSTVTLTAPATMNVGTSTTLSASVASQFLVPTGTVTLFDGATAVSPALTLVNGAASFSWTPTSTGSHVITAVYSGDTNVLTSTSSPATVVVTENGTLSIADATVTEGNAGITTMTFTVTLSAPATTAVTVSVDTANGTALAPGDYAALNAVSVTFAAGETSKSVTVSITGDMTVEPNESFTATITGTLPAGITILRATATGTITNDDVIVVPPVEPKVSITQICTGTGNTTYSVYTWTVTNRRSTPVTLTWRVKGVVPAQTGTITLAGNATSSPFTTTRLANRDTKLEVLVNGKVISVKEAERTRRSCLD